MRILLLIILFALAVNNGNGRQDLQAIQAAVSGISAALKWAKALQVVGKFVPAIGLESVDDCVKLYEASAERLERLVQPNKNDSFSSGDAVAWLSGAMAGNMACLAGLRDTGMLLDTSLAKNLNYLLENALASLAGQTIGGGAGSSNRPPSPVGAGLLASWSAESSNANVVVAKDGSGHYATINDALAAVAAMGPNRPERTVIYVRSGTYKEQVNIHYTLKNLFFVGDGIGSTIVTGDRNRHDYPNAAAGATRDSATFAVNADGFWARDITFRNTAGPAKGQAVALAVASDRSVLYRCSMEGYQDTLLAWQLRQFYRDCQIHGTVDYVFGDAAAVFQSCDFVVRLPLTGQYNAITAQGRDSSDSKTGFVIMDSRVVPSPEFAPYKASFRSYLGRPWQNCSRVLFARTEMDDLVDPEGWAEMRDDDPNCGRFFGEYKNTGSGADTSRRVKSPSFHVVDDASRIAGYSMRYFIQGDVWLPATGVPFSADDEFS